jgi:hypothetical protein
MAMGSPLAPVVANYVTENFEKQTLDTAPKRPTCCYRYVDDMFVIWLHGIEELPAFQQHLSSIHTNIEFTMETQKR